MFLLLLAIYSPISGEKCSYDHRIDPTGHGENLCIKSTEGTEKKRTDKTTPSKNYLLLIAFALQSTTLVPKSEMAERGQFYVMMMIMMPSEMAKKGFRFFFLVRLPIKTILNERKKKTSGT